MPRCCSRCGASIGTPAPVACRTCGAMHWANAKPAAAALVVQDGKLLLTRRAIEPWLGLWCAPSGFCDEAGMRVRVTGYLGVWIAEYAPATSAGDDAEHVAVAYYHAVPAGPAAANHDSVEVAELAWFAPGDLPRELA